MNKLGFVGMGNMATALCSGFIKSGLISGEDVYGYAPHFDKLKKNAEKYGFVPKESLVDMVKECDTIILACKPYQIRCRCEIAVRNAQYTCHGGRGSTFI